VEIGDEARILQNFLGCEMVEVVGVCEGLDKLETKRSAGMHGRR